MANNQMTAELRTAGGKGVARKLRAAGRIPGVFYGNGEKPVSIQLDPAELNRVLTASDAGMNTLIDLSIVGNGSDGEKLVLVKEIQSDPITGSYLHADFMTVDLTSTIQVTVRIQVTGTAEGVRLEGGILDQVLREIELECMPTAIPKEVELDVTELSVGQSLHVRDIVLPEGVKLLSDGDLSVVSVIAPKEDLPEEDSEEAEGDEAAAGEGAGDAPEKEESAADGGEGDNS
ncbi:50S ribosomal protein L25 [Myxococcota bacterium]|nr:50S ribosomal protein L25 [Myxococcota bacterium]